MTIKKILRRATPFAAVCVLVCLSYIGYRVFLVAGPNGIGSILGINTQVVDPVEIGCDGDTEPHEAASPLTVVLPASYQEQVRRQPALSANLIHNANFATFDEVGQAPAGFYRIIENESITYAFLRDQDDNGQFLRAESTTSTPEGGIASGWASDPAPLESQATYAYGLEYKTTVPVDVTAEFTLENGQKSYRIVTRLEPGKKWQRFTAHLVNTENAKDFRFIVSSRQAGQVDTRKYDVHRIADAHLSRGIVSVTFDDGWQSIADHAVPLLDKYDIKTTQYVMSKSTENTVAGYMDATTVKKLHDGGHEIGSHSIAHCDQTRLSKEEVRRNAQDSEKILERLGLGPITAFAYPYGQYNQETNAVVTQYYPFLRSSDQGFNDRYFDTHNIRAMVVLNSTTEEQFRSWVQQAKDQRVWLVVVYHRVDEHGEYNISSAQLERQLKIIKDSGLYVAPLSEAARMVNP